MRTSLIIIALALLALLAGFVAIGLRPDGRVAAINSATSRSPSFEVRVVKPLSARPLFGLFGLLPTDDLRFGHESRGASIGRVAHDRLELSADGWDLAIEIDGDGRLAPGTRLVFPLELGGRQVTLRCRPADRANGYLRTTTRAGADELGGSFLVKLATCENVVSGKALEWPPAPLTVVGSFDRLPHHAG
ncbi:MAG: hypothetical protein HY049_13120 [Acidobacteria bacterium]|nr:hypothetical protein [Acidobacteriota bacterium]